MQINAPLKMKSKTSISVRRNALANYAGTFCQALLGFVFIPLYIKYLGIENYGLIGFSVSLSALFRLADLGLSATLNRELARYSAMPDSAEQMRSLLKMLQAVYWAISLLFGLVIFLCAPLIVRYWINSGSLNAVHVENAVMLMGLTIAFQAPMSLYLGGIFGLQRHVLVNGINIVYAALRHGGVVVALAFIAPTLNVFFMYQLVIALIGAVFSGFLLWRLLPRSGVASRFKIHQLKSIWRFAAGMSINSVLWLILSQLDKIILIKVLPLRIFGYYALASTAAVAVTYLGSPLFNTFLPRYTQLYAAGNHELLRSTYRRSCRLNAVITIPAIALLAIFSSEALLLWTGNPDVAHHASLLLSFLVIGHGLNQLALMPFALQIAAGWVKLGVYTNLAALILYAPALVLVTLIHGALGATCVWIALGCFFVFIYVNVLHSRILKGEARHWYAGILPPLALSVGIGLAGRVWEPDATGIRLFLIIGLMWIVCVATSFLAISDFRKRFFSMIGNI